MENFQVFFGLLSFLYVALAQPESVPLDLMNKCDEKYKDAGKRIVDKYCDDIVKIAEANETYFPTCLVQKYQEGKFLEAMNSCAAAAQYPDIPFKDGVILACQIPILADYAFCCILTYELTGSSISAETKEEHTKDCIKQWKDDQKKG